MPCPPRAGSAAATALLLRQAGLQKKPAKDPSGALHVGMVLMFAVSTTTTASFGFSQMGESKLNHQELDRRFWSMVPFTRIPCWVPIFDPQPCAMVEPCGVSGKVRMHIYATPAQ